VAHPQIAIFARLAEENSSPTRLIYGQPTLLSRTMHDIRYDEVNDEILVTNPFAQALLVFRGAANGQDAPIRVIQGPDTQLMRPDRLAVDPMHDEIVVPSRDRILVFPRTGNGNVAPIRVIRDQEEELNTSVLAVDPVHNLFVARSGGSLRMFNRTDDGEVKPLRVIEGPSTGINGIDHLQVYPPKGWIVAANPGSGGMITEGYFIGVWSIQDNGDIPPRWKLAGARSVIAKPRGVALDPVHKEIIVADMRLNMVLTYYFPEIF
jgi:hypothetical protein